MEAKQLFRDCKFDEAVAVYKDQLSSGVGDELANIDGLSRALMAAGKYAEAIPYLERVGQDKRLLPGSPGEDKSISVCYWVLGERERGFEMMRALVVGVRDRVITYADMAGGVSQGIMLCYMATALQRDDDVKLALTFLADQAKKSRIQIWPGPAALLILGTRTIEDSIERATGVSELARAKPIAEADGRKRRHLTNVLFAAAVSRRLAGDDVGGHAYMAECAGLTNPLAEYEWYLARSEVSQ